MFTFALYYYDTGGSENQLQDDIMYAEPVS